MHAMCAREQHIKITNPGLPAARLMWALIGYHTFEGVFRGIDELSEV